MHLSLLRAGPIHLFPSGFQHPGGEVEGNVSCQLNSGAIAYPPDRHRTKPPMELSAPKLDNAGILHVSLPKKFFGRVLYSSRPCDDAGHHPASQHLNQRFIAGPDNICKAAAKERSDDIATESTMD